ncbi:mrr restriction system protein [Vibrio sp. JCM 19236]|nr:mrr restriction system protein [Vibrio sp. JCM 19236]
MISMGYGGSRKDAGQATQYTQDGGIDGIIKEDKLGLEMIYLQAKRYSNKTVGRPEIQAFAGALDMHKAKKGVFITTSSFSKEARNFVDIIEKRIVLIDGEQLTELMLSHNLGVSVKQIYEIKTLDTDYFDDN